MRKEGIFHAQPHRRAEPRIRTVRPQNRGITSHRRKEREQERERHERQRGKTVAYAVFIVVVRFDLFRFLVLSVVRPRLFEREFIRQILTAHAKPQQDEHRRDREQRRRVQRERHRAEQAREQYVQPAFEDMTGRDTLREEPRREIRARRHRARHERGRGRRTADRDRRYHPAYREYERVFVAFQQFAHEQVREYKARASRDKRSDTEREHAVAKRRHRRQEQQGRKIVIFVVERVYAPVVHRRARKHVLHRGHQIPLFFRERTIQTRFRRKRLLLIDGRKHRRILEVRARRTVLADGEGRYVAEIVDRDDLVEVEVAIGEKGEPTDVRNILALGYAKPVVVIPALAAFRTDIRKGRRAERFPARRGGGGGRVLHGDRRIPADGRVHRADVHVYRRKRIAAAPDRIVRGLVRNVREFVPRVLRRADRKRACGKEYE